MAAAGKSLFDVSKWRLAEWILFCLAAAMFLSLLLPWIKRTALYDPDGLSVAESLAAETSNPFSFEYLILPREGQLDVALMDFFRGRNAFYIFSDLRDMHGNEDESQFFVGHLLGVGNYTEKAYLFVLFPILAMCVALVAISKPKGLRLAAYLGAALFILYLGVRLRLIFTDGARELAGVALGPGLWIWLYSVLLLSLWLILRATFPRSKFF